MPGAHRFDQAGKQKARGAVHSGIVIRNNTILTPVLSDQIGGSGWPFIKTTNHRAAKMKINEQLRLRAERVNMFGSENQ